MTIRFAQPEDARGVLEAHYSAVHETAAKDYARAILCQWSAPVTPDRISGYINHALPSETTLVAEIDGRIAGFGSIVESKNELRAVYVAADFSRRGVGSALLKGLERLAKERGCKELQMVSSLTAVPFYLSHGFEDRGHGIHALKSGGQMACVSMRKTL